MEVDGLTKLVQMCVHIPYVAKKYRIYKILVVFQEVREDFGEKNTLRSRGKFQKNAQGSQGNFLKVVQEVLFHFGKNSFILKCMFSFFFSKCATFRQQ